MTPRDVPAREDAWTIYVCPDTGEAVEVDDGCSHVHWNRDELEPVEVIPLATAERESSARETYWIARWRDACEGKPSKEPPDELDERGHCRLCGQHGLAESDVQELHDLCNKAEAERDRAVREREDYEAGLREAREALAAIPWKPEYAGAATAGIYRALRRIELALKLPDSECRTDAALSRLHPDPPEQEGRDG